MKNQPRIKGTRRIPTGSSLIPDLRRRVQTDARAHDVSRAWVVACILADHYHVQTADYRETVRRRMTLLRRRT